LKFIIYFLRGIEEEITPIRNLPTKGAKVQNIRKVIDFFLVNFADLQLFPEHVGIAGVLQGLVRPWPPLGKEQNEVSQEICSARVIRTARNRAQLMISKPKTRSNGIFWM